MSPVLPSSIRARSRIPQQQTCKACGQPDKFDFDVPDEIWSAVVPKALRTRVVCLYCFDEYARENNVNYAKHLTALAVNVVNRG